MNARDIPDAVIRPGRTRGWLWLIPIAALAFRYKASATHAAATTVISQKRARIFRKSIMNTTGCPR